MPELPEVETIRLTLKPKLIGKKITGLIITFAGMLQELTVAELETQIINREIVRLERRGKYLLLHLSGELVLAIHLRMTGQLTVEPVEAQLQTAIYFRMKLDDGNELRFRDQRKFGKVFLFAESAMPESLNKLGPEPLEAQFSIAKFRQQLVGHPNLAIKKALLNQEIIAGIGNIYADEALFVADIHPARLVSGLSDQDYQNLYEAVRQVLTEGIEHRGTTKKDYRDGEGNPGSYQDMLRVYGRKGLPCPKCQTPIAKMTFGGRGTHFCPLCQG